MKAITALLALGLLCCSAAEARLTWQYGIVLRGLLQVQPITTAAPGAVAPPTTTGAAVGPTPSVTQPATEQPAAVQPTVQPATTAFEPEATTAANPAVQPATTVVEPAAQPGATAATADPAVQPAATTAVEPAAQPAATTAAGTAADPTAEAVLPSAPVQTRPGVYPLDDPVPSTQPAPAAAGSTAATGPAAAMPGKNLMVVMTVMGADARAIYSNQDALKQQLAAAAAVTPGQVYFFNQTANNDARTGVTAVSLIMNVDCTDTAECAMAGALLRNSSSQTKLTDGLAKDGISLLPGTFQVYTVNSIDNYKGNATLYEDEALLNPRPATALDYNATMARFATPQAPAGNATAGAAGGPGMPLGNFTIPGFTVENNTIPSGSTFGMNFTQGVGFGNLSLPGTLPGDVPAAAAPAAGPKPRSAAAVAAAGVAGLPLLVAVAVLLL